MTLEPAHLVRDGVGTSFVHRCNRMILNPLLTRVLSQTQCLVGLNTIFGENTSSLGSESVIAIH